MHNCSTIKGSSGSPIILRNSDNSIIGLHYESNRYNNFNISTNIISIINHIKNYNKNNNIIAEIEIKEKDANKKMQIINSSERWKKSNGYWKEEDYYKCENEKEMKENCEITIDNNIIPFCYYFVFKKEGKYKIEYNFINKLSNICYMFSD